MIKKDKSGYTVVSHTTGRKFGHYKSKKAAKKRIAQMAFFKHKKTTPLEHELIKRHGK